MAELSSSDRVFLCGHIEVYGMMISRYICDMIELVVRVSTDMTQYVLDV